jgi:hypothetical protein
VKRELSPLTRSEDDRRELIVWAVACAERALPLFEQTSPLHRLTGLEGTYAVATTAPDTYLQQS